MELTADVVGKPFYVVVKEKKDQYRGYMMGPGGFSEVIDTAYKFKRLKDAKFFSQPRQQGCHVEKWTYSSIYNRYVFLEKK